MSQSPVRQNVPLIIADEPLPDDFRDMTGNGVNARPTDTMFNAMIALRKLDLDCSYNIFRDEFLISGKALQESQSGEVTDAVVLALRHLVRINFLFEPSSKHMQDAVMRLCTMRSFHPIKNYFASLPAWDGVPRASKLLSAYFSAPDTPLNDAISRIVVMASVRRILRPGTKFDYMTVLQSAEGYNKSSAIEALYGEPYFTDQSIIGLSAKDVEEALRGQWAQESPELSGIGKADWNKLKATMSRKNDRVRRAYGRNPANAPRTVISWGTSNDDAYLRALSGENRRFLSVDVLKAIDVAAILADRDQIWSEAVALEATGESIALPEEYWADARAERDRRTESDPWEDVLRDVAEHGAKREDDCRKHRRPCYLFEATDAEERVASVYLFEVLSIDAKDRNTVQASRIARIMRSQGWSGPTDVRIGGGKNAKGYKRPIPTATPIPVKGSRPELTLEEMLG